MHTDKCATSGFNHRHFLCVSLDGSAYGCVFGCDFSCEKQNEVYDHYRENHSAEELEQWAINKEVLEFRNLPELPAEFVKRQLNRYKGPNAM